MDFKHENKGCNMKKCGCSKKMENKLNTFDWLSDIDESHSDTDFVEVQFKNTRKGYFRNTNGLQLQKDDVVAVEATPGHDIGTVTLTGRLVLLQMKKLNIKVDNLEVKRVYRKAKPVDLEKYEEAKQREHETMLQARKISEDLKLNMKIGDVEFQGDGNKAIFYYIADDRVDFRQLIKVFADTFKVRIEMKQIGVRQEAGRIGGIGPCGRPLCCSSWMTNFVSVSTSAARHQDISLNPQKLAGQCAKLKCCLNYEVDSYVEAQRQLPSKEIRLETKDGVFYHFKTDIFNQLMTYSSDKNSLSNLTTISADRVFEIIALNKKGIKPDTLLVELKNDAPVKDYYDGVGEESLTRFDREKKKGNSNNPNRNGNNNRSKETNANGQRGQKGNDVNKPVLRENNPAKQVQKEQVSNKPVQQENASVSKSDQKEVVQEKKGQHDGNTKKPNHRPNDSKNSQPREAGQKERKPNSNGNKNRERKPIPPPKLKPPENPQ